jgi:hypothetical protein
VATFLVADTVVYNFSGFVAHVRLLLDTPAPFREFPRTISGEAQMAWRTIVEMRYMFGWPLAIVVVIAFASESVRQTRKPSLAWLLVPAISYYFSFVGVILFYFDRYFLPITIVHALYAGAWLERFLARDVRARGARIALVAAAFAYTVVYVAVVDYAMAADSRYAVSRWIRAHAQPGDVVAALGPLEFAMIADEVPSMSADELGTVAAFRPAFVVLNADQMPSLPDRVQWMHDALMHGRGGYRLALTAKTRMPPLPGLHPDLGDAPRHGPEFSDLSMIDPTIEVFERTGSK